jgi:hypothetical protein
MFIRGLGVDCCSVGNHLSLWMTNLSSQIPLTHPEFRTLYAREGTGVPLRLEDRGPETHPIDAAIFGEGPGRPGPIFGMI